MNIIITGGGTGGHVYPAIAIADALKTSIPGAQFLYVGVKGRAEEQIVPAHGYRIRFVMGRGLASARPGPAMLWSVCSLAAGIIQALFIHLGFRPEVVIGTGGYASVPALAAALILRRLGLSRSRIFIHEQNFAPGRFNRLFGRFADRVWVSFEGTKVFFRGARVETTGYPVREKIAPASREKARRDLGIPADALVVLAFGGSQGARTINRALADALPILLEDPRVVVLHGTGTTRNEAYDAIEDTAVRVARLSLDHSGLDRYRAQPFIKEIQNYYAAADLVVCRGGAGTLNEIRRCGRAALIVPKSQLAGEHQVVNALALVRDGAAEVIFERPKVTGGGLEAELSGQALARQVLALLHDPQRLAGMSEAARPGNNLRVSEIIVHAVQKELAGKRLAVQGTVKRDRRSADELDIHRLASLSPSQFLNQVRSIFSGKSREQADSFPMIGILRYFTDIYLASPRWQVRNAGVKLTGLLYHLERRDLLLSFAADRTPAKLLDRLLGGDFAQVGFIRRNALDSLARLGVWDENLLGVLVSALTDDHYYEARVEAARAAIRLRKQTGACAPLTGALLGNLGHKSLEVRWTCLEALGACSPDTGYLDRMERFMFDPNWRIRQGLIRSVSLLYERGLVGPGDGIVKRLEHLIPTCTDFVPTFPLKKALGAIPGLSREILDPAGKNNHRPEQ